MQKARRKHLSCDFFRIRQYAGSRLAKSGHQMRIAERMTNSVNYTFAQQTLDLSHNSHPYLILDIYQEQTHNITRCYLTNRESPCSILTFYFSRVAENSVFIFISLALSSPLGVRCQIGYFRYQVEALARLSRQW